MLRLDRGLLEVTCNRYAYKTPLVILVSQADDHGGWWFASEKDTPDIHKVLFQWQCKLCSVQLSI